MRVSLSGIDQIIVVGYFLIVLAIGFFSRSKKSSAVEFLLAGRTLTLPIFVMTLVSSWYGGILGVGEFSYLYGISNWVIQGFPYYFFAGLFAFFLASRVRRTNLLTIPDQLHAVYGKKTALLGSVFTFILMTPAPNILMLAILLQLLTGWGLLLCLALGTLVTSAFLVTGGFRSDVNTDVFEFFLMFIGFFLILPFAYLKFGGIEFLQTHVPPLHLTWNGGNSAQFVVVWFFIALWTFVDPSFHQRCYAAKNEKVARNGILISILFWFVFDAMTTTAGLYARAVLPGLDQPMMSYPLLAEKILPSGIKGLFYVGMLATIMSTLNSQTFVSAATLGKDILWRSKNGTNEKDLLRYTKWGLLCTALFSISLSFWVPSVVGLWYTIGTLTIPGLLVPLVSSYFSSLKMSPQSALLSMFAGGGASLVWFLLKERIPFQIEPMYPGLFVSIAVWGFEKVQHKLFHKEQNPTRRPL